MRGFPINVGLPLFVLSAAAIADAQTLAAPQELAASLSLDHHMRDMMTIERHRYQLSVTLRVEPSGAAQLQLRGSADYQTATLEPRPSPGAPAPREPRRLPIDERWTGHMHREQDTLVVEFDRSEAYRPAVAVHVLWRCTPATIAVDEKATAAWVCRTSQSMTKAAGVGYPLTPYLQVPMYLALPAVRLHVQASARGGADHRSSLDYVRYSRHP